MTSEGPVVKGSRRRKQKYEYEPCIGVKTDFESLLQRFSSFGTVRYEKFAECWKELNMSCYCAGRQSQREAREFVEDCFLIASQFWLPPSSFLIRAGALYLLYGLYYFQLVLPKVKIRITHQQWLKVLEFQQEARGQQHHDLDYIFHKMLLEKAFLFVASDDDLYPKQKGFVETKVIPESMKDETGLLDEVFSHSAVNQLSLVHDQYQKMKIALNSCDTGQPDTSLNIVHTDLIESINKTLETHKERQKTLARKLAQNPTLDTDSEEDDPTHELEESVSTRKHLKLKAFEQGISGYNKKTRNEKEDGDKSWHIDMSQKVTQSQGRKMGSKNLVGLFDRDENEDTPIEAPKVQELFCMPDIDDVSSSAVKTTGSTSEGIDDNTESTQESDLDSVDSSAVQIDKILQSKKGSPAVLKSKVKTESKREINASRQSKSKRMKFNDAVDDEEAAVNSKKFSDTEKDTGKEFKYPETKLTPKTNVKGGRKKTNAKKSATDTGAADAESGKNKVKELTAQEKLHMKLSQKRKDARLNLMQKKKDARHGANKSKGRKKKK